MAGKSSRVWTITRAYSPAAAARILCSLLLLSAFCNVNAARILQRSSQGEASSQAGFNSSGVLASGKKGVCDPDYPGIPFHWHPADKVLALTFDDGPVLSSMSSTLDVLKAEGDVKATFFVNTADRAAGQVDTPPFDSKSVKDLLMRLLAEGHELGSHADEHLQLTLLPAFHMERQLTRAIERLRAVTGMASVPLFRAPYADGYDPIGLKSPLPAAVHQLWDVVKRHHLHIGWSFEAKDWAIGSSDAPNCTERLFDAYGPPLVQANVTGVVLMHALPWGMAGCPAALHKLIQFWRAAGYKFVTVSTLVRELYGLSPAEVVQQAQQCSSKPLAVPVSAHGDAPAAAQQGWKLA